ncbi:MULTISPECIES: DUF3592 domain-containing protein [Providencia]|uniref:DUF3592 domain-containing protein n=1 Tax=Providencia TaxID=586 RepID=UPI0012B5933B|nr:DUF3592 domain-containing protein [Providencia rettgeri]MTC71622.1 DUF3592 domain-containing protein [Providencia sp. wls1914]QLR03263.1 DUF3592 domain-containing protein [Providencia rettgeri]
MKIKNIIFTVFLVIGILFLLGTAFSLYSSMNMTKNGVETTGIVTDLDVSVSEDKSKSYFPIIEFTTQDNQKIEFRSSMGSSSYRGSIGQSIDVLYDPTNPHDAVINSFFGIYALSIFCGIFGVVFTLIGGVPFAFGMVGKKKNTRLLREGTPIQVKITGVEENTMIQINKQSPYQILADVHDKSTNTIKRYKSENIYFDPSPYIDRETVTIYLDKNNANKYYMDISFLPKMK